MLRLLLLLFVLALPVAAQQTVFVPNCSGLDDTAKFTSLIAAIGANTGTIRLPWKNGTRCAVSTLTIPSNITLDNTDGTGIRVITGQVLTVAGPVVAPVGKTTFFGPGITVFTGNTTIGSNGQALTSNGAGGSSWTTISGGGGGGVVDSVFGRTGAVVAVTNDYTWAQIDKANSSLTDITFHSANELSNGTIGTGAVVLRDSPSLITPSLGVASATSINGIGLTGAPGKTLTVNNTLALSATSDGFTLTVPATGTAVLESRTITEGAGLAGNTYDLSANRTLALGTPSSLSVSSLSTASGTTHSHAIASSSNPGAAASILASNASGHLQLTRLGIATAPTQPLEVNGNVLISAATANLFLKDTSTGLQAATTGVVTLQNNNALRSSDYTSGIVGWNITAEGDAEFNNLVARGEIRSSVFKVNEIAATAGTFGVFYSASTLSGNAVIPAAGSFTFDAKNSDAGGMLLGVGDIVRMKGLATTGVSDTWATITARVNNGTTTTYTATFNSGTTLTTYPEGGAVVDYGPSGTGFITLSSDGTVGSTPNLTMATHSGSPWSSFTTRARVGNLNGSYGYATDIYGFATGQYGTAGQSWVTVDQTNGVRIGNNATARIQLNPNGSGFVANNQFSWDTAGNVIINGNATIAGWTVNAASFSNGNVIVAAAQDQPTSGEAAWFGKRASDNGRGVWLRDTSGRIVNMMAGLSGNYPYMSAYDGVHSRVVVGGLNFPFEADGATDSMGMKIWNAAGNLLVHFSDVANTIAGWTISTTTISSTGIDIVSGANAHLAFGTTPPASAAVGTGIWLDRTGLYGLNSSVLQTQVTSTGQIKAGAGALNMDVNGLYFAPSTLTTQAGWLRWFDASGSLTNTSATLSVQRSGSPANTSGGLQVNLLTGVDTGGQASGVLSARNDSGTPVFATVTASSFGTAHAQQAGKAFITLVAPNGSVASRDAVDLVTTPVPTSTAFEVRSTTGAVLFPRMTTTQRDALTATDGMVIYNSSTNKLQVRAGGAWVDLH